MSVFQIKKLVSALPLTLEPNTVYLVRVGSWFDIHVTDSSGTASYVPNSSDGLPPDGVSGQFLMKSSGPLDTEWADLPMTIIDGNGISVSIPSLIIDGNA